MLRDKWVRLVRTRTADGLWLDASYQPPVPENANRRSLGIDGALLIHGTGGNFYAPGPLERLGDALNQVGVATLRINTRGHDGLASIPGAKHEIGASYETVADARFDVQAWLDWLCAQGHRRLALLGHSMGGVKAGLFQARSTHASVVGVVCLCSPRFHHASFLADPIGADFRNDYAKATSLVAAGAGEDLMNVRQPLPMRIAASKFLDKYGPEDRYDLASLLAEIETPTLVVLGQVSRERSLGFRSWTTGEPLTKANPRVRIETIQGADVHLNPGYEPAEQTTLAWFESLEKPET